MRALLAVVALWLPVTAGAEPCQDPGLASGPVQVGLLDGEAGVARRVCPATELGLGGAGLALIDEPNFFGQLRAAGQLWGSWAWNERTESFVSIEVVRYQTVIASVSASDLGFGHTSVGTTHRLLIEEDWSLAAWGRLVLPTAFTLYENAWPVSADVGATGELQLSSALSAHGSLAGSLSAAVSRASAQPRFGLTTSLGGGWQPLSWFGLVLELEAGLARTATVDHVAGRFGLRFRIRSHWDVTLAAMAPFAGRERALAAGAVRISWRP